MTDHCIGCQIARELTAHRDATAAECPDWVPATTKETA